MGSTAAASGLTGLSSTTASDEGPALEASLNAGTCALLPLLLPLVPLLLAAAPAANAGSVAAAAAALGVMSDLSLLTEGLLWTASAALRTDACMLADSGSLAPAVQQSSTTHKCM